jgi:hypothetical protein
MICSLAVAAGSMIMIGMMLYKDWPQWKAETWRLALIWAPAPRWELLNRAIVAPPKLWKTNSTSRGLARKMQVGS